jgi:hypothetical protein
MSKTIWFILILFFSLLIEAGIFSRFSVSLNLSLFLPLIFISALVFDFEEALALSLMSGFMLDITTLQRFPFWSIFLLLEVVLIVLSQKRFVDLTHNISIILLMTVVVIIRLALQSIVFQQHILNWHGLYILLINLAICYLILGLWVFANRKGWFLPNEKRSKTV